MTRPIGATCLGPVDPRATASASDVGAAGRVTRVTSDAKSNLRLWNFDYNRSALKPAHRRALTQQVLPRIRRVGQGARVVIWGHASQVGPRARNQTLARQRAEAVKRFLLSKLQGAGIRVDVKVLPRGDGAPCDPLSVPGQRRPVDRAAVVGVFAPLRIQVDTARREHRLAPLFDYAERESRLRGLLGAVDHPGLQTVLTVLRGEARFRALGRHEQRILALSAQRARELGWPLSNQQLLDGFAAWKASRSK